MARPATYTDDTVVSVSAEKAKSKLQSGSERRAIVNKIVDLGGKATIAVLEKHYGYDIKQQIGALVRGGWLIATEKKS